MTLTDITREIGELAARSVRVQSDLKGWINRAQRIIAERHDFNFMHSVQSVTMAAAATSANLPATFKSLGAEKSPITYTDPTLSQYARPVTVSTRAGLEAMAPGFEGYVTNTPTASGAPNYVFLEQNDGGVWTLNILNGYPVLTAITYRVSCYLFPADLALASDHNGITDHPNLAEAIIEWTKAKALGIIDNTDPQIEGCLGSFERNVRSAIAQDARRRLVGRSIHM